MHWADVFILGLIVGGTYLGSYRGLVLELTDWVMFIGSALLGFRLYRWLGAALRASFLKGWTDDWAYGFAFLFFALPAFITLLSIGLHLDRVTKEQDRLPPELRKWGGGVVALAKYIVFSGIWIGYMNNSTLMTSGDGAMFRRASVVTTMRNLNGFGRLVVRVVLPSDMADKFITAMNRT